MNRIEFRVFSCATCVTCGTAIALTIFCLISTKMPFKKKTCQPQYKKHSLYSIQGAKFKKKSWRKKQFNAILRGSHLAVPTDSKMMLLNSSLFSQTNEGQWLCMCMLRSVGHYAFTLSARRQDVHISYFIFHITFSDGGKCRSNQNVCFDQGLLREARFLYLFLFL